MRVAPLGRTAPRFPSVTTYPRLPMKTRLLLLAALTFAPLALRAENEIGFIEKFALAPDREVVLGQLLPGSEDYYFFHALHYQNTAQAAKLAEILDQWSKRFPNSTRRRIIENRAALLAYDANPPATLKFLRERLNLEFNHEQQVRDKRPDLPTKLDQKLITRAAFQSAVLRSSDNLNNVDEDALRGLVRDKVALKPSQVRDLLKALKRPDVPGLVEVIEADLKTKESRGFGEFGIHRALLPEQLDDLAKRIPTLRENHKFVHARLRKLAPGADADGEFDPAEREAWLERLWAYAKNLSPSFNTLKAHILFQRLQHDRTRGVYDKARFLEYLKLPRRTNYVNPEYLRRGELASQVVDFNADPSEALVIAPPIRNDEALVRDFLLRLLKDEPTWEPWAVWLRDTWLKPVFAEAKITAGVGNPEQWASLLTPTAFQALKDRVDVDFSAANPPFLAPADDVSLDLFLKNTPKLIVKIYEINTLSYFLTNQRQLNTDLALDGLVANREVTHDFTADEAGRSPFRRTARTFKFPELKGQRGAWVIEFIGGGKSSRALVRKGQWSVLQRTGPAGEMLTVLDETRQPVKDAVVWLAGRKLTPDEKSGYILVPFTVQPGTKNVVLADAAGHFATLSSIEHHAEEYKLDAQIFIEREQVLAGRQATIAVRAALLLNDAQVSLDLLKEPKLSIATTTLDGISTTAEVKISKLDPAKVFTHTITIPERLERMEVALSGEVEILGKGGERQTLRESRAASMNGINKSVEVRACHLSKFGNGYFFELLGRNGEPVADQQVVFVFRHRDFWHPISVALRTDERGRVEFGELSDRLYVDVQPLEPTNDTHRRWGFWTAARRSPESIHAKVGDTITVPWTADAGPQGVSLLEMRAGTFTADRSAMVTSTPGSLVIKNLPPGDYSLIAADTEPMTIRVTAGQVVKNWLVSTNRDLEIRETALLNIESIKREDTALVVQLSGVGPFTRVHVAATRFLPESDLFLVLGWFRRFEPTLGSPARLPNLFAAGRAIGDEYRYILERRYAKLFPGNMLPRPGLILNPWEVRSTDLQAQEMTAMQRAAATTGGRPAAKKSAEQDDMGRAERMLIAGDESRNFDFLATASPVLYNLVPDEKGVVRIDLKALGDRQHLQIYAEDLTNAVWRTLALAEVPTKFQDLRLARNLDPQKPFAEKKEATVLANGQTLTFADILTAELETYDSLAGVHALFTTLSGDAKLAKFAWVLQWPELKDEEKRAKFSEFACHELSFFLAKKDPAFFQKVVLPYLRNKKDRTFLDDFLLGNDLRGYLEPWAFARLNMAERALLAQRVPGEAAATARALRELWDLVPPNPEREDQLFETALRGRALQQDGVGSFKNEKQLREAEVPALGVMAAAPAAPRPATEAVPAKPQMRAMAGRLGELSKGADKMEAFDKPTDAAGEKRKQLSDVIGDPRVSSAKDIAVQLAAEDAERAMFFGGVEANRQRGLVRQFFRALGPTMEWAENNYYQLPIGQQNAALIPINAFWRDFAAWDGKAPFVSPHLAEAARNFSEMMLALAVLDLPFEAPKHTSKTEAGRYTLTAAGPLLAFHKEIKSAVPAAGQAPLLVSQNFFRADDRFREEGNEKFDKYVTEEFLFGVVYGANIVVTNPTSAPQKVTALLQIPHGALPVNGSKATDSRRLRLEPYSTQTLEYFFYFPQPALAKVVAVNEPHYPVHVSRDEQVVGAAQPFVFKVVPQLTQVDKTSWDYLSQYGTDAELFEFLDKTNLARLDLERIAWRARKSADFFRQLIAVLEKRHIYSEPIYRYAIMHNAAAPLAVWLRQRDDFVNECGPWLDAKLLKIDPIERRAYEHLEYSPLVNQRAHRVGAENRIANPVLRGQYQRLLQILAHKPTLEPIDQMSVTYFLFLQDRVEEALARFKGIAPAALPTRLQHDYFRAYAAFYEEQPTVARGLVQQYADYPVDRWRKVFAEVAAQLDEIEGRQPARPGDAPPDREKQQGELAATEPTFDFKVENRQIALTWKNLGAVTINYYLMDPEFLFSASPFVTEDTSRFSIIKPTRTVAQALPAGQDALALPLPGEFAKANVLVEILGAGQRKAQAYHANTLKLTLAENYGRLEVRDEAAGKPVRKAYVKVYARLKNGAVRFYKDGYTDLRGKFDYASLNSSDNAGRPIPPPRPMPADGTGLSHAMLAPSELGEVEKLAILLMSEGQGAAVREVAPPRQ
jgi:hypothetical protein